MTRPRETVLVTGSAGYIGSVLVRQLLEQGRRVRAMDSLRSGGESLAELVTHPCFEFVRADVREIESELMEDCAAVVHLAAIVGDPACRAEPELARSINVDGSKRVYEMASAAGVGRFVFASTCSNYGKAQDASQYMREDSPLRPVSLYAETKVEFERFLLERRGRDSCVPVILRFSTVYGVSPRMRFDLTVNEFTRDAALGRTLIIYGEQFWRPYCHVTDLARSVCIALDAADEQVALTVFNVGDTAENYTKRMLADALLKQVPELKIDYVERSEDPRDYRVEFARVQDVLGFNITRTVPNGIREVMSVVRSGLIGEPNSPRYGNT